MSAHQHLKNIHLSLSVAVLSDQVLLGYVCHQFLKYFILEWQLELVSKTYSELRIHSIKLDVYAVKQSALDLSFNSPQRRQGRNYYALTSFPFTTSQNWYDTG